jgi:hypothetical protein
MTDLTKYRKKPLKLRLPSYFQEPTFSTDIGTHPPWPATLLRGNISLSIELNILKVNKDNIFKKNSTVKSFDRVALYNNQKNSSSNLNSFINYKFMNYEFLIDYIVLIVSKDFQIWMYMIAQ